MTLLDGVANDADLEYAARITARFSQGKNADKVVVETLRTNGETKTLEVEPLKPSEIKQEWYV